MFLGTYNHNLDPKNRVTVPSKFRNKLDSIVVLSKGFDGCLELRTNEEFQKYANKLTNLTSNKANYRAVVRQLLANANEIEIDNSNRILIPMNLLKEGKITKEIIFIGLGNKIELWDSESYIAFKEKTDLELEVLAEDIENETI